MAVMPSWRDLRKIGSRVNILSTNSGFMYCRVIRLISSSVGSVIAAFGIEINFLPGTNNSFSGSSASPCRRAEQCSEKSPAIHNCDYTSEFRRAGQRACHPPLFRLLVYNTSP